MSVRFLTERQMLEQFCRALGERIESAGVINDKSLGTITYATFNAGVERLCEPEEFYERTAVPAMAAIARHIGKSRIACRELHVPYGGTVFRDGKFVIRLCLDNDLASGAKIGRVDLNWVEA